LIIRHGAGYHSLLAGFGQVDMASGRRPLMGGDDKNASVSF
jgi:septal ring factor EnvC (AmiA/AmiB activator)